VDSIKNGLMDRIVIVLFALAAITITTLGDISILNYSLSTTLGSSDVPPLGAIEYTPAILTLQSVNMKHFVRGPKTVIAT